MSNWSGSALGAVSVGNYGPPSLGGGPENASYNAGSSGKGPGDYAGWSGSSYLGKIAASAKTYYEPINVGYESRRREHYV